MEGATVFHTADDGTLPGTVEEQEAYLRGRDLFQFGNYYRAISPLTFCSQVVPLSEEQTRAWRKFNLELPLEPAEQRSFQELRSGLQQAIDMVCGKSPLLKAFVRLSVRSPKDAAALLDRGVILPVLRRHLRAVATEQGIDLFVPAKPPSGRTASAETAAAMLAANGKLIALKRTFFELAAVSSASEALALMKNSSRLISDMKRALTHAPKLGFGLELIVRQFVSFLPEFELRAFVHQGRLTALSQYFADIYVPGLEASSEAIKGAVACYFEERVRPSLLTAGISDCIVDLALFVGPDGRPLHPELPLKHAINVIELNPFLATTGSCLFDWQRDHALFTGQRAAPEGPFEFRFLHKPRKGVRSLLAQWDPLLTEAACTQYPSIVSALALCLLVLLLGYGLYIYFHQDTDDAMKRWGVAVTSFLESFHQPIHQ